MVIDFETFGFGWEYSFGTADSLTQITSSGSNSKISFSVPGFSGSSASSGTSGTKIAFQVATAGTYFLKIQNTSFSETSYQMNLSVTSVPCETLDGAILESQESTPTFLGFLGNRTAIGSVNNSSDQFGSSFGSDSIRSNFGPYSSSFSQFSAKNSSAASPPQLVKDGVAIAFLTTNPVMLPGYSLDEVDACIFNSSTPARPTPCTNPTTGSVKLQSGQEIELPMHNTCLLSPSGSGLSVPATATAVSINVTVVTPDAPGFVTVYPCGVARPNASNLNYVAGDVVPNGVIAPIGANGSVCLYSQSSTDIVVDVAGWFEGESFAGATPQRLVDTRDGTGSLIGQIGPSNPLVIQATGISATTSTGSAITIPSTAGTVALNLTVVNPTAPGFITAYPCDGPRPLASNVNYVSGQVVANGVIAPVSSAGQVCLYSSVATDIIADLAGWFPGDAFTGSTPKRFVDTRDGTGAPLAKLTPSNLLSIPLQGAILTVNGNDAQVPLTASAAALNVTLVNPEAAGFVTVWPCSAARPNASNLNFVEGQTVANNVVAPIGDQGNVCFYSSQSADIIVDVSGYFMGISGNQFVSAAPKRFIDTRNGTGPAPN